MSQPHAEYAPWVGAVGHLDIVTDSDLLKLAASAVGLMWVDDRREGDGLTVQETRNGALYNYRWMPLADDGDALRLAVKLDIDVGRGIGTRWACHCSSSKVFHEPRGADPYAATRRAIVRAAAALQTRG